MRSRVERLVLMGVALVLSAPTPAVAEWTLSAFAGASWTRNSSLTLVQPVTDTHFVLSPVHYDSASFDVPPYYGYRIGYFPKSTWFGIEGEIIHVKVVADTTRLTNARGTLHGERVNAPLSMDSVVQRFSITHGVNLVLVNFVARRRFARSPHTQSRLSVSGRFGAGASIPHPESTINVLAFERYEWGAFSLQAAVGLELRLRGPVGVMGEYKLSRTDQEVTIAGGSATTSLVTHHAVGGLVIHLAR